VERLVNVGQQVKAGQPLMRIDETDLRLALTAKNNAVAAARASVVQLDADERRYASLRNKGWISGQRYEQARAALDTAEAQLAAAEAQAGVAENETTYSVLVADVDGTVVETLGRAGTGGRRRPDRGSACPRRPPRSGGGASRNDHSVKLDDPSRSNTRKEQADGKTFPDRPGGNQRRRARVL
jgi:pyruvate/2-oxoglutarate dehydrogenase complex dihydrolipoamide acyltransferase (E2) component